MSTLIKTFNIPKEYMKQYAKYSSLELYDDKLVGKGNMNGDITYYFKSYMTVQWTPASLATQFAYFIFVTTETSAARAVGIGGNLATLNDMNRIPFCGGMFSYQAVNDYVKSLYLEIKEVFNNYKAAENESTESAVVQKLSNADEIKKYKELADNGIITQDEFEAKKKQLLGL